MQQSTTILSHIYMLSTVVVLLLTASVSCGISETVKTRINDYLSDPKPDATKLRSVLESGSMNGHFTSDEVYSLFSYLQEKYPEIATKEVIGSTYLGADILMFRLKKPAKDNSEIVKSKMLFTGNHHARELLTVTICLKIFIESIHSLVHQTQNSGFWTFNDLLIVPIINLDSHTLISESFGTSDWDEIKYKRKNMNEEYCP